MAILESIIPAPRKVMTIFYMIDTSGSMCGTSIGTVNAAMEECQQLLNDVAQANDDAEIKVAVMKFDTSCSWVTPSSGPVNIENWKWDDLIAGGLTSLGEAFKELDSKLSRSEFLKSQTGAYAPVIILLSDGYPTDSWENSLNKLKANNWFKHAIKIAIDVNSGSDKNMLALFTGTPEAILDAKDKTTLKKMLQKVSVRASEFQSHSKQSSSVQTSAEDDAANIVKSVIVDIDEEIDNSNDNPDWENW